MNVFDASDWITPTREEEMRALVIGVFMYLLFDLNRRTDYGKVERALALGKVKVAKTEGYPRLAWVDCQTIGVRQFFDICEIETPEGVILEVKMSSRIHL